MDVRTATRKALECVLRDYLFYSDLSLAEATQELRRRDRLKSQGKPFRIKK